MSATVYEQPREASLATLEDDLSDAFETLRAALGRGETAVVALADRDLAGAGDAAAAALAHGLLGLARALAIDGRAAGWQIAVLSCAPGVDVAERARWIEQLSLPGAASGALIRLGGEHLGKAPL